MPLATPSISCVGSSPRASQHVPQVATSPRLAGSAPIPFQSGDEAREQGISKEGNTFVRSMAIQIAWGWLRYQPESKLICWYQKHFGRGSRRLHKIGIVALARRLLIDLWRYLETGLVPEGAELITRLF